MKGSLLAPSTRLTIITLLLAVSSLSAATHYVSLRSTNPKPPYTNWVTAAMNIQDALNVAAANDVVLVTNGVYPGGVSVLKALTLRSVNGPQFTIINGRGTNRCVDLTYGASLTGFTLTNGYPSWQYNGGGVECASTNAFLTNCLIVGNSAYNSGGGAYGGTLYNCTLSGNSAGIGGGGGGALGSTLYNCTLSGNWAHEGGGGAAGCTLYNCTLSGNRVTSALPGFNQGGGAAGCTLCNCIVYFNTSSGATNFDSSSILNYCCTTPLPARPVSSVILGSSTKKKLEMPVNAG